MWASAGLPTGQQISVECVTKTSACREPSVPAGVAHAGERNAESVSQVTAICADSCCECA